MKICFGENGCLLWVLKCYGWAGHVGVLLELVMIDVG